MIVALYLHERLIILGRISRYSNVQTNSSPLKNDAWNTIAFPFEMVPVFLGGHVNFREGYMKLAVVKK